MKKTLTMIAMMATAAMATGPCTDSIKKYPRCCQVTSALGAIGCQNREYTYLPSYLPTYLLIYCLQ